MPPREKPTFFLYQVGRDPEELCLGNLVLKDYANPTLSRHYTHPRLNEDDLKIHASSTQLTKGWEATISSETTFKPSIDVLDFFQIGVGWERKREKTLTADEGCRVVLKDPEKFLHQQVLSQVEAVQELQIWISGANRGLSRLRCKPKIWLLTGFYLLKNASFTGEKKRTAGVQAGINSTVLTAIGAPSIGISVDIERSNGSSSQMPTQGWHVWAAQYMALDYRVLAQRSRSADIRLLYDVVSQGTSYFSTPDWARGLTLQVAEQSDSQDYGNESAVDDVDYQKIDENFWRCKTSQWLIRENFQKNGELTPEQKEKYDRSQQAEKDMKTAGLEVGCNSLWGRAVDGREGQEQLARDAFTVAEEKYEGALADYKSSLGDQARKVLM